MKYRDLLVTLAVVLALILYVGRKCLDTAYQAATDSTMRSIGHWISFGFHEQEMVLDENFSLDTIHGLLSRDGVKIDGVPIGTHDKMKDKWGNPIEIEIVRADGNLLMYFRSRGADGTSRTDDDILLTIGGKIGSKILDYLEVQD